MNTKELLNLDYYKGVNSITIQNALNEIKPLSKYVEEIVPLEVLEKLIHKYEIKYAIMVNYICPVYLPNERKMYSVTVKNTETKELYPTIYGSSIYEVFAKLSILYHSECTKHKKIPLKDWSKKYET